MVIFRSDASERERMQQVARSKLEARRRQMALKRNAQQEVANDEKLREAEVARRNDVTDDTTGLQLIKYLYLWKFCWH